MTTIKKPVYRLFIDESGDHTGKRFDREHRKYLGLTGIIVRLQPDYYKNLAPELEKMKMELFDHDPEDDELRVILHRSDVINRRKHFTGLFNKDLNNKFEEELIKILINNEYTIISVVIDKASHFKKYREYADHPYHYCLQVMMERYCGYLNHLSSYGDIMVESRSRVEDILLKREYKNIYNNGTRFRDKDFFQRALTSRELKLKKKLQNVVGLQIADCLAHPVKQEILMDNSKIDQIRDNFGKKIIIAVNSKFNRHLYTGTITGYGKIFLG